MSLQKSRTLVIWRLSYDSRDGGSKRCSKRWLHRTAVTVSGVGSPGSARGAWTKGQLGFGGGHGRANCRGVGAR